MRVWGSTPSECARHYPCEDHVGSEALMYRAVSVAAPVSVTWRWLCQLTVAPYSYDLIDNLGRRSPRTLTPGADELLIGQRVMAIFTLASFDPGRSFTLVRRGSAVTYEVVASGNSSRILVAFGLSKRAAWLPLLAVGDLVMMRKQLLTLKQLAEAQ